MLKNSSLTKHDETKARIFCLTKKQTNKQTKKEKKTKTKTKKNNKNKKQNKKQKQNKTRTSLKLSVPYEKDTLIYRSEDKQLIKQWKNQTKPNQIKPNHEKSIILNNSVYDFTLIAPMKNIVIVLPPVRLHTPFDRLEKAILYFVKLKHLFKTNY